MNFKDIIREFPVSGAAIVAALAFTVYTATFNKGVALAAFMTVAIFILIAVLRIAVFKRHIQKIVAKVSKSLGFSEQSAINGFPMPVMVCGMDGKIEWYNEDFLEIIAENKALSLSDSSEFRKGLSPESFLNTKGIEIQIGDRTYCVYANSFKYGRDNYAILYYSDISALKAVEIEYNNSKPYILLLETDNIRETGMGYRESEIIEIKSALGARLESWFERYQCVLRRLSDERFIVFVQQQEFLKMQKDKFSVLDDVRKYEYKNKRLGITVSIGAGGGDTLVECEQSAERAIEMALGRGGDQVAIKTHEGYDFFGGVSRGVEKRNKVRTRIVASSIMELISASDNVIIIGHSYPDLDAVGAAVGLSALARSANVPAYIAIDKSKNLAMSLVERYEREESGDVFINEELALSLMTKKTLLIVVDTHISGFADFESLLNKAEAIIVIDHHRKAVNYISETLLFYHDPNASSTCEMVTELFDYILPEPELTSLEAEALFSGIMLDTKNFVLRAGVRTFEAAAKLKSKGADTVKVKQLFSNTIEINRLRNEVISAARAYKSCAIAYADFDSSDKRIICSQAADELLSVSGVIASFVLYEDGRGGTNISARSFGEMNVQLTMEALGGGGHRTMAAVQLPNCNIENATDKLQTVINQQTAG